MKPERDREGGGRVDPCTVPPPLSALSPVLSGWEQSWTVWVMGVVLDVNPPHLVLISPLPVCLPLCCHLTEGWLQLQPCGAQESPGRTNTHHISSHGCLDLLSGGKTHLNAECCSKCVGFSVHNYSELVRVQSNLTQSRSWAHIFSVTSGSGLRSVLNHETGQDLSKRLLNKNQNMADLNVSSCDFRRQPRGNTLN